MEGLSSLLASLAGSKADTSRAPHFKFDYIRFPHLALHQMKKKSDFTSGKTVIISIRNDIIST
jgi:hypothetical protein